MLGGGVVAHRTILDRIRYLGYLKDREVKGAKEQLRGAIIRLRRANPFMLQLPRPLKVDLAEEKE